MRFLSKSTLTIGFIIIITTIIRCEKEVIKIKEDTLPPVIEYGPEVLEISDSSATIFWITDEPCSAQVKYGISSSSDTLTKSDTEFRQNHLIVLDNLNPNTSYFHKTVSFDISCNIAESEVYIFTTKVDIGNFLVYGWEAFETDNYSDAEDYFRQYVQFNSTSIEGSTGFGWCQLRLNSLQNSINSFFEALDINEDYINALSGLILSLYQTRDDISVIIYGKQLFEQDSLYVFEHDTSYNYRDIHLILADSYNSLGMEKDAQTQIDFVFPNNLNPDSSETWVLDDSTYSSYEDALTALIEYLKVSLWGNSFPKSIIRNDAPKRDSPQVESYVSYICIIFQYKVSVIG